MNNENQIPSGYWQDAKGALIPESIIKPIDKERNALVLELVDQAKKLNQQMKLFKNAAFGDIAAFVELSAEQYQVKIGGKKGNITLTTFDGKYKIQRSIQEHISFDERLQAAKELVDSCLKDWTANASPELKAIIDRAFDVDKQGKINTTRVLALRRLDIRDDRWLKAMTAISEAVQVTGSKSYLRVFERIGDTDQYQPISLDIAGV